jgi:hypothetical protein
MTKEVSKRIGHHVCRATGAVRDDDARDGRPCAIDRACNAKLVTMAAQASRAIALFFHVSIAATGTRTVVKEHRLFVVATSDRECGSEQAHRYRGQAEEVH